MARNDDREPVAPAVLAAPHISLVGEIDKFAVERFQDQLRQAEQRGGDIALEVTTEGGEAELARRIVLDIDAARARLSRRFVFIGKTVVYSAGVTIMSAFPRADRWLADDAMVMIHCRKLDKQVQLSGPIRSSVPEVEALLHQLQTGIAVEERNFRRLIEGSDVGMEELWEKALRNWYLTAEQAVGRGLAAGIWRAKEKVT